MLEELEDEIRYGRDHNRARIFVSSRMDGSLDSERKLAATTIDRLESHRAWWWEQDAPAGVLHSVNECVNFARTSDGLVLLIAGPLSAVIYAEYSAAKDSSAETYIFIREGETLPDDVRDFIARERGDVVTRNFQNEGELETHLYQSLNRTAVRAIREMQLMRRRERAVASGG
ncbi:hypothetical protein [Salinibacterium sp. ZJ450]|uniref:hypothetical protein n=1 Tax=Salinibacterium sp. ZJ450 TaxID=2708338 RepID=UPI001423AF07|nr:hypothetical protein [Salinibacterium sp. ZJ450]